MRNKAKFIDDAYPLIKEEYRTDLNVVEDAAKVMSHTNETRYVIGKQFTNTNKDEVFNFEVKKRPMTDDPDQEIEDFFYVGKGE